MHYRGSGSVFLRKVKYLLTIFLLLSAMLANSQAAPDSLRRLPADTLSRDTTLRDSAAVDSAAVPVRRYVPDTSIYAAHPFYRFTDPVKYTVQRKKWEGKEGVFYALIALLLFFALVRNGFPRYLQDLFKSFFQTSLRQRQIRDQLQQSPLPSLLMNAFFVLCAGLFLTILLRYFRLGTWLPFWLLFAYCTLGLTAAYTLKYLSLKFFGWLFQVSESTETYIFIVFTANKVIGIALLPFLVALAFGSGALYQAALTMSLVLIGLLLAYRYFLSWTSIHRQIRIDFFHFLLYLLAFELAPLLLINKLLLRFLRETS
jgi:hypothetical protein